MTSERAKEFVLKNRAATCAQRLGQNLAGFATEVVELKRRLLDLAQLFFSKTDKQPSLRCCRLPGVKGVNPQDSRWADGTELLTCS